MNVITEIKQKLGQHPNLVWADIPSGLKIEPPSATGFAVWIERIDWGIRVGFDGWHQEFEDESEALNAFAFGLSNECRLKVIKRGSLECAWTVEHLDGDRWVEDSTTGLIFIPFWRSKTVEYRQNSVIVSE